MDQQHYLNKECLFCNIIRGEIPSVKVYEDDQCLAFMDIMPINSGHTLVVPKGHSSGLGDLDPKLGEKLFSVGMHIAEGLKKCGVPCEGINFFLSDGEVAGQEILHTHLHVLPRYQGDGFGLKIGPHGRKKADPQDLSATAQKIKERLESK